MTPLEEIEQEIESVRMWGESDLRRAEILGPLYQARAIERLEATVRAIGVILQTHLEPENAAAERLERFLHTHAKHGFYNVNPEAAICQICGHAKGDQIHA